jgi:excisionase family DNA binding protein
MKSDKPRRLFVKPTEAAAMLSVGRSTIYELIASGMVPSKRIGGTLRIPTEALEGFVKEAMAPTVEE